MSHEIGSTTAKKLNPENIGVAVEMLSLCALELEMWVIPPLLPEEGMKD